MDEVEEVIFTATGSIEDPELVEEDVPSESPVVLPSTSLNERIQAKIGMDFSVFTHAGTWKAFGIAVVLFAMIGYAGLTVFGLSTTLFATSEEADPIPDLLFPTLNRTGIESPLTNETGWFRLSDHPDTVVIIDMMAHDCSNCHDVQNHIEEEMDGWHALASDRDLIIIAYGAWYQESLAYLNMSDNAYTVPKYATGLGGTEAAIINGTELADPVRLLTPGGTGTIPVALVIDHQGYIVGQETSGSPTDGWAAFDGAVVTALTGTDSEIAELRTFGVAKVDQSMVGVIFLGAMLSILVYFSPCAFPVLPGFISYYLTLGAREDELIASGKLKGAMPNSLIIGTLSAFGMWTFFFFIGMVAAIMGDAFASSGIIHDIALGIAALLFILGFFMLTGGTAHLMGWVQRLVDKYSTTEMDDRFTPRRNMYLYGIGYAAASIDCTAAAVIPFVIYLSTISPRAVMFGLGSLMIGLLFLMISVVSLVGLGRQAAINFLRRATEMIKQVGSWMMMFAGLVLMIYISSGGLPI